MERKAIRLIAGSAVIGVSAVLGGCAESGGSDNNNPRVEAGAQSTQVQNEENNGGDSTGATVLFAALGIGALAFGTGGVAAARRSR